MTHALPALTLSLSQCAESPLAKGFDRLSLSAVGSNLLNGAFARVFHVRALRHRP